MIAENDKQEVWVVEGRRGSDEWGPVYKGARVWQQDAEAHAAWLRTLAQGNEYRVVRYQRAPVVDTQKG